MWVLVARHANDHPARANQHQVGMKDVVFVAGAGHNAKRLEGMLRDAITKVLCGNHDWSRDSVRTLFQNLGNRTTTFLRTHRASSSSFFTSASTLRYSATRRSAKVASQRYFSSC